MMLMISPLSDVNAHGMPGSLGLNSTENCAEKKMVKVYIRINKDKPHAGTPTGLPTAGGEGNGKKIYSVEHVCFVLCILLKFSFCFDRGMKL